MEKAIVLLSGGQDSTTALGWARQRFDCTALSIHYGQRHVAELEAADLVARTYAVPHVLEQLPVLQHVGGSALVDPGQHLQAAGGYVDKEAPQGLPTSFVPGRNLLFLSIAGAYAVRVGAKVIVTGVCQTDYSGYPDCRQSFINAMEKVLDEAMPSGCGPFTIHTPLMNLSKADTVRMALDLPGTWAALHYSVTCYEGRRPGCGRCGACELRRKGFAEAGVRDPAGLDEVAAQAAI